jgi:SAM-dependent methyltransferase
VRNSSIRQSQEPGNRSVAIVVTSCRYSPFLAEALRSCLQQTVRAAEIWLVSGGATHDVERIAGSFPEVLVHRVENVDPAVVRSAVLARISSVFILFLDADDRLTPLAIEAGLTCFESNPDAWLVCGGHRVIDAAGRPASPTWYERIGPSRSALPISGAIAVQAAVMYRADRLRSITGCEANLEAHQRYDLHFRSATHDHCVAEYRYEKPLGLARSMVSLQMDEDRSQRSRTLERFDSRLLFHHNAPQMFAAGARQLVGHGWNSAAARTMFRAVIMSPFALLKSIISRTVTENLRRLPRSIGRLFGETLWAPGAGKVRFGDFGRTAPISVVDGFDRGKPIDRYYIERALANFSELVRGRVLEVGESHYTRMFGGEKVVCSEVFDIDPLNPAATVIGDLGAVGSLPEEAFDCIVLTQTLQYVYHLDDAIDNLYRALTPDGSLLITVPGISPIGRDETQKWLWEFTELSLKTMLISRFGESNVRAESYGNVFAAICFLTGLSIAEIGTEKLDYRDERYPVTVVAWARKLHKSE